MKVALSFTLKLITVVFLTLITSPVLFLGFMWGACVHVFNRGRDMFTAWQDWL